MSVIRIENEKQMRLWDVDSLSEQIWHNEAPRQFPIYLVFYQGRPCGFFVAAQQTVIYPAIHPELMSAKGFVKVVRSLVTEMKRMTGDPLFLLCGKAEELGERHMKLLRLKRAKENAYIYYNENESN